MLDISHQLLIDVYQLLIDVHQLLIDVHQLLNYVVYFTSIIN